MNSANNKFSRIVIVGGGPAGSSLAIRLAGMNFEVVLLEREKFPRQKLCGEFISPECLEYFDKLGVLDEMIAVRGDRIAETVFYEPNGRNVKVPSKWFGGSFETALSISRSEMDFRLLKQAQASGAEILEESNVTHIIYENDKICGIKARKSNGATMEIEGDLIIDASGRAAVLSKIVQRQSENRSRRSVSKKAKTRYVGFKTHVKDVDMKKGACEIYFFRGGYGGLSFVENGFANHCFLIKAEIVKEFGGDADRIVENVVLTNKRAAKTLRNARVVREWLAVSVDEFGKKDLCPAPGVIAVGDSSAFIDPFTGSGMLMALEGAEILAGSIIESKRSLAELCQRYQKRHNRHFKKRLIVCSMLRRAAYAPSVAKFVISTLDLSKFAQEFLTRATRPTRSDCQN